MLTDWILPFFMLNEVREDSVNRGPCLAAHAQAWADNLADTRSFRHSNVPSLLDACDKTWTGQVMARSRKPVSLDRIVRAWMASPTHRAVITKPRATHAGIGKAYGNGWYVVVVNYGDK